MNSRRKDLDDANRIIYPTRVTIGYANHCVNTKRTNYPNMGQNMSIVTHIAQKIRELRTASKMSQTKLAEKLDVTPNTVSRWESGTYKPSIEDLDRIARVFEKPIWALLPGDTTATNEAQRLLLSKTGDLPPEDINELARYAEFVRARQSTKGKK